MSQPATAVGSSVESPYVWTRLCAALVLSAIGGVGMWSVIVVLPAGFVGLVGGRLWRTRPAAKA